MGNCLGCNSRGVKHGDLSKIFDYDLIVVGGGPAGIKCALEASKFDKKVLLCNYVEPTPHGKTWGIGGTSTNVGCLPKMVIHQSCEYVDRLVEAPYFGWKFPQKNLMHDWEKMIEKIQNCIRTTNFQIRVSLNNAGVHSVNAYASFVDSHTILLDYRDDTVHNIKVSAEKIVLAVGMRPGYDLDIVGCRREDKLCITTDELFSRTRPPGKTYIIGDGYISVELASFFVRMGYEVTMFLHDDILEGMDKEFVWRINNLLAVEYGIKVVWAEELELRKIERVGDNENTQKLKVTYWSEHTRKYLEEEYDTIILERRRITYLKGMRLQNAGVKVCEDNKIIVDWWDQTSVSHIYAIGDCASARPENAAFAAKSGRRLIQRLYKYGKDPKHKKYWTERGTFYDVPFVLRTPIEYGTWGLSEEDADAKFGDENVLVYQTHYEPLEWALSRAQRPYMNEDFNDLWGKLICLKTGTGEKLMGFHYLGPHAGEIATTMAMGTQFDIRKKTLDEMDEIYPTIGRMFVGIQDSKAEDRVYNKAETYPY